MGEPGDAALIGLMRAVAAGDAAVAARVLAATPALARAAVAKGATRGGPDGFFLEQIGHYVYAGHTALHVAAAAYQSGIVSALIGLGADVRARNRRGAGPLHAAAVGVPGASWWNPPAQVATIACLVAAGADPNAADPSGVTPLHRAVRTRCAAAVKALLELGADPHRRNKNGSTAMLLATHTTGRGGSGSPAAKAEQAEIVRLLAQHGVVR